MSFELFIAPQVQTPLPITRLFLSVFFVVPKPIPLVIPFAPCSGVGSTTRSAGTMLRETLGPTVQTDRDSSAGVSMVRGALIALPPRNRLNGLIV